MTSKRIDDLPLNDPLSGLEMIHGVQNGNSRKIPAVLLLGGGGAGGLGSATQLISGGGVAWESGYTFRISAAVYLINGLPYQSIEQTVTLDAASVADDRIDAIALDTNGYAVVIKGDPGPLPFEPDVDPSTQLELTAVTVVQATSQPPSTDPGGTGTGGGSTAELVYTENAEWAGTVSNARWNLAAASHPHSGAKHIKGTALATGDYVRLTRGTPFAPASFSSLRLFIESFSATWGTGRILLTWLDLNSRALGSTVTVRNGTFGLKTSILGAYQQVVIPLSSFGLRSTFAPKKLHIRWSGGSKTVNIDDISLIPSGATSGGTGTTSGGLDQAAADVRYLNTTDNLADLDSAATARNNLDVYSKGEVNAAVAAGSSVSLDAPMTAPPSLVNWIQQNFGTDTTAENMVKNVNAAVAGVRMKWAPAVSNGNNYINKMLLRPIPGTHWRVTARLRFTGVNSSYNVYGIALREASSNHSVIFGWNSDTLSLGRLQMFGDTTYNNDFGFSGSQRNDGFRDCWHRISYDGTIFRYYISFDGWTFVEVWNNPGSSVGSVFTAPSHLGFAQNVNDAGAVFVMQRTFECIHWVEEVLA